MSGVAHLTPKRYPCSYEETHIWGWLVKELQCWRARIVMPGIARQPRSRAATNRRRWADTGRITMGWGVRVEEKWKALTQEGQHARIERAASAPKAEPNSAEKQLSR